MKLVLDNRYQITSDAYNYILQERKTTKIDDGETKEYEVNIGYYSTITNALKGYKELQIRTSNVATVNELINLINELDKKIEKFLRGN